MNSFQTLDHMPISWMPSATRARELTTVSVLQVLTAIKSGVWKNEVKAIRKETDPIKRTALKVNMPAVTFAGEFLKIKGMELISYTGIIVIDIDRKVTSMERELIMMEPETLFYFRSPSGGLKIGVMLDCPPWAFKEHGFQATKKFAQEKLGIKDIDEKCKNLNRLCFVSHDSGMYISPTITPLRVPEPVAPSNEVSKRKAGSFRPQVDQLDVALARAAKWADKNHPYIKGSRNFHIYYLACQANRYGVPMMDTMHYVLGEYDVDSRSEAEATVKSAYSNHSQFGIFDMSVRKNSSADDVLRNFLQ